MCRRPLHQSASSTMPRPSTRSRQYPGGVFSQQRRVGRRDGQQPSGHSERAHRHQRQSGDGECRHCCKSDYSAIFDWSDPQHYRRECTYRRHNDFDQCSIRQCNSGSDRNFLTSVATATTPVVNAVAAANSGASASASSLGCGVNAQANGTNAVALGTNASTGAAKMRLRLARLQTQPVILRRRLVRTA